MIGISALLRSRWSGSSLCFDMSSSDHSRIGTGYLLTFLVIYVVGSGFTVQCSEFAQISTLMAHLTVNVTPCYFHVQSMPIITKHVQEN
jgi:hypothetical protein